MYKQVTDSIEVTVHPAFQDDHSQPESSVFIWSYEVAICNRSSQPVQLMRRHWKITNAYGQTLEVEGEGVIGNQPVILPGETYAYSSFTNLATASGYMVGTYDMSGEKGIAIKVAIPPFSLDSPQQMAMPN
jgi:ApaG protein